jgi:hypothetical protein
MNPRKKESKKWTKLPLDFSNQIKTVFEQNFKPHLEGKKLTVEGRIYPSEIVLRIGINQKGELRYHNFEVSLNHSKDKQDAISQIHIGVDAIASLMVDYFDQEEEHEMPLVWQEYPFEKQTIWLQYTSENSDLEAEANRLLGLAEDEALLTDEEKVEFADEIGVEAEEGTTDEEDVDMSRPQIFGGSQKKKKENLH